MAHLILTINPGSTSTKIALFEGENGDVRELFNETLRHKQEEIDAYGGIIEQIPMRKALTLEALEKHGYKPGELSVVMGRGGLLPPVHTGGYLVDEVMLDLIMNERISPHISNIGAVIAHEVAKMAGGSVKAYIYDAVSASDLPPIAKVTGFKELKRESFYHVLNSRAVSIHYAKTLGKRYEDMNLIVVQMGGGVTAGVHCKGKIIDTIADDNGPFGPERSGGAPLLAFAELCFESGLSHKDVIRKIRGTGGLRALIGTSDGKEIEALIEGGDENALQAYEAQAYQISKAIGLLSPVLKGDIDAIILTGGMARSDFLIDRVKEHVGFLAPVAVIPGEFEMNALALGGLRIITGAEQARRLEV